jgi:hypothetical protein
MTRQKQPGRRPATTKRPRSRQERDAQEVQDLPNREAMSILDGVPNIRILSSDLLAGGTAAPASGDPTSLAQPDPDTVPADASTAGPTNQASSTNLDSSGTTETTSAAQEAPITQT